MPEAVVRKNVPSSSQKMPPKLRLKLANECDDILARSKLVALRKEYKFHVVHSKSVDEKNLNKMMNLFEPLMRDPYEKSSWGWDPEDKLSEWTHARTRVILVTKKDSCDIASNNIVFNELPSEDDELIGFMCIRFEKGGDKSECACYVYELHILPEHQRQGLGGELMRMAKCMAISFKMDKVMLTVFRSNAQALKFYDKLNFKPDKSSPSKDEADYMILSLAIKH